MEPEMVPDDATRLERFLSRLRKAPHEKRRAYALGGAAAVTACVVAIALAWRLTVGGGDRVPLSAALGDTFSSMRGTFAGKE